jgi:putative heme-binding domain-containing protein
MPRPIRFLLLATVILATQVTSSLPGQGFPPDKAVSQMTLANGLEVRLVASEPEIRQPILVKVDDRGRLWTIQYLQYPNPAGLTRVKVDRWSRTIYDRIPKPPPHGPRGADRLTILEDIDGDGRADKVKDFTDGLNLATGIAFGHGGVYVLQVPYLLFYPDRNHDDRPDRDPDVLLSGFGMQDAQSLANHLTWGPDGWLYGVNGSTTTCQIRGIEFQQGVWRYHPGSDRFELFCEGGGNTFGLTFDRYGELFYSTNGGPFIHALQGAYYRKSFGKHGPLHNPYAYGFFNIVDRDQVPGGPPTGGTIYQADMLPDVFRGQFIAGNFLGHGISSWTVQPDRSTVRATYQGELLRANDSWFGATDLCQAPDGSLYVCDFHDKRTAHPDPDANWDRSNGRIYQVRAVNAPPATPLNLFKLTPDQLVDLLGSSNQWLADRARVQLASRKDRHVAPRLRQLASQQDNIDLALEGLWALQAVNALDQRTTLSLLQHPSDHLRRWTIRLACDNGKISTVVVKALALLAANDPSLLVRRQLAISARRLPFGQARQLLFPLLKRSMDHDDPRMPLLLWWAIEEGADENPGQLVSLLGSEQSWDSQLLGSLRTKLLRRWAAGGTLPLYTAAASLLEHAPASQRAVLEQELAQGLEQRAQALHGIGQGGLYEQFAQLNQPSKQKPVQVEKVSGPLATYILGRWTETPGSALRIQLALLAEIPSAYPGLLDLLGNQPAPDNCEALLRILGPFARPDALDLAIRYADPSRPAAETSQAISILGRLGGPVATVHMLDHYGDLPVSSRARIRSLLLGRHDSAKQLVAAVKNETIAAKDFDLSELRVISLYQDDKLDQQVRELWGRVGRGSPEEKLATMRRLNNDLRNGSGNIERGKPIFIKNCGTCHRLFDEGNRVGPDLTNENRADRSALLATTVDPSSVVKRDYLAYIVTTTGGQVLTGLLANQDAASVTLLDAKNNQVRIPRTDIESLNASPLSLMPDGILEKLTPQELCDLFAYLQRK